MIAIDVFTFCMLVLLCGASIGLAVFASLRSREAMELADAARFDVHRIERRADRLVADLDISPEPTAHVPVEKRRGRWRAAGVERGGDGRGAARGGVVASRWCCVGAIRDTGETNVASRSLRRHARGAGAPSARAAGR